VDLRAFISRDPEQPGPKCAAHTNSIELSERTGKREITEEHVESGYARTSVANSSRSGMPSINIAKNSLKRPCILGASQLSEKR
jgi:hypothetical protein